MNRHRVYLDQNKWISLLRNDSNLEKIRERVDDGEIVCPISLIHLVETASYSKANGSVDNMFDLMLEISQNYTMAPLTVVREEEIGNKVDEMLGRDTSMDGKVVGQGIAFSLGGRHYDVVSESGEIDEEIREKLLESVESEWASEFALNSEDIRETLGSREYEEELVDELEEIREENEKKFNDNSKRRKHEVVGYFQEYVIPEVLQRYWKELVTAPADTLNPNIDHGMSQERLESEEYAYEWIQDFRAVYTHVNLTVSRDLQKHRNIKPNDLNDIMALSVAIPYCDTVVTEGFWENLSSQSELGELYDTNVTSDIEDVFDV